MTEMELSELVIATARALNSLGLSRGTSGNVSARIESGCLITPSGVPYADLTPERIVPLTLDGRVKAGSGKPSSEWRFHCAIYEQRPDIEAIVHCHSTFATSLACTGQGIPAFHYMVAVAGGVDIRCAPYATFGTEELSNNAVQALRGRSACLLANHGQIACGPSLDKALSLAQEVEGLAEQYYYALQFGNVQIISNAEMERVVNKFQSYGAMGR